MEISSNKNIINTASCTEVVFINTHMNTYRQFYGFFFFKYLRADFIYVFYIIINYLYMIIIYNHSF